MSRQTDIARARIMLSRAEAAERVARKAFEAAQNKYMSYSHAVDRASLSLMDALKANGQCVICEKPQDDCEGGDDHVVRACAAETEGKSNA